MAWQQWRQLTVETNRRSRGANTYSVSPTNLPTVPLNRNTNINDHVVISLFDNVTINIHMAFTDVAVRIRHYDILNIKQAKVTI